MPAVSVVVCVRNSGPLLAVCLESIAADSPAEIIVVDGRSTDESGAVARRYTDIILNDPGTGLAEARNIGLDAARSPYVAFIGPDNIVPPGCLASLVQTMEQEKWAGVSAITRLADSRGYLERCMELYKSIRLQAGEVPVIGSPVLYRTSLLAQFRFDGGLTHSDDTDLAERMVRAGLRVGRAPVVVYEQGTSTVGAVLDRWSRYGRSDAEFYRKYSKDWSAARKVRSLLHPLLSDFVGPAGEALKRGRGDILPFLLLVTVLRYYGWVRAATRQRAPTR